MRQAESVTSSSLTRGSGRAADVRIGQMLMYDSRVTELAERVLLRIRSRDLMAPGDRVAVAVSGGVDSVALLLLMLEIRAELGIVLSVAHVNHKLRGHESNEDQEFVSDLARRHKLDFHLRELPLPTSPDPGIEAAARELRYGFFRELMVDRVISKVATAHTIDDQAETVLLRILRGTGLRGLAGIHPRLQMKHEGKVIGEVVRPLLDFHRNELEPYLCDEKWREDSSNLDSRFSRNRIRHRVLPILKEEFGEGAVDNLADLAEIARAEEEHWSAHAETVAVEGTISIAALLRLPLAAQRRMIRNWLEREQQDVSFRLIDEIVGLAHGPAGRRIVVSGGCAVRHSVNGLCMERTDAPEDYEYWLPVPGEIVIPEIGSRFTARRLNAIDVTAHSRDQWLDPARLPGRVTIRNWRPGDRYWPAHTKEQKKAKDLLSDKHVTGVEKKLWPVAVAEGGGLVWMRGFPVPAAVQASAGTTEVVIIGEESVGEGARS